MTAVPHRFVDWRNELNSLADRFADRGGVVHVTTSPGSGASTFAKAIRHRLTVGEWERPWVSVQIDSVNPSTHYLEDIVVQLQRSIAPGQPGTLVHGHPSIQVGTGIVASAVELSDIAVFYNEDAFSQSSRASARIEQLSELVRGVFPARRIALIFLNSHEHDRRVLHRVRTMLWDPVLRDLVADGLLLIDISDPASVTEHWPPEPDLVIQLPEHFGEAARAQAEDDLATIAMEEGLYGAEEPARAFASTTLALCDNVSEMYSRLGRAVARLHAQLD